MRPEKTYRSYRRISKMTAVKIFVVICVVLWMAFIFSRSLKSADESNEESGRFVRIVCAAIEKITGSSVTDTVMMSHTVRKAAHFIEYSVLGVLTCAAFALWLGKKAYSSVCALVFSFGTACSDELIQTFSAGRAGRFYDVLIDVLGSAAGILLITLLFIVLKRKKLKKKNKYNK